MQYVKLAGMDVSRICLGCMSFGVPDRGTHPWTLDADASRVLIQQALDGGINFFDTANVYSDGTSEEIVGAALRSLARRDEIVLATKVHGVVRPGPNGRGLSRKAIMAEIDNSLRRLGTDFVDLYQIHRWDPMTPIEETLEALNDVVRAGKARYIGASSMYAWQFSKALYTSAMRGWPQFVSMQNHYNLLYREEEREMLPLCRERRIGALPWSPLARGRLARAPDEETQRTRTDEYGRTLYRDKGTAIIERVGTVADAHGATRSQVALAWLLSKEVVVAPIVGATKAEHLSEALAALDLDLGPDEIATLEEPYAPQAVSGIE